MKVTCPKCGKSGYLTRVKVRNKYYMRVEHVENGKRRVCYLGRDVSDLRQHLERALGVGNSRKIVGFPGGDYYVADILRPRLETLCPQPKCTFVEVFGGSGYMSQTVSRAVFSNVIYNDINDMLTTLYRYIKEHPEQLVALLALLPYSRAYYRIVRDLMRTDRDFGSLVGAALIFYFYNTSFLGKAGKGFAYATHPSHNHATSFRSRTWAILKYAETWRDVTIEQLDFREVLKKYDGPKTVFYLDPPYPNRAEEYYGVKFTADDLRDMATMLAQVRGRFLLKIDEEMYDMIRDVLSEDKYGVEVHERVLNMRRVKNREKGVWKLVLVTSRLVSVTP